MVHLCAANRRIDAGRIVVLRENAQRELLAGHRPKIQCSQDVVQCRRLRGDAARNGTPYHWLEKLGRRRLGTSQACRQQQRTRTYTIVGITSPSWPSVGPSQQCWSALSDVAAAGINVKLLAIYLSGTMRSFPISERSAGGTAIEPSACWWFSRMAIIARLIAIAVPLSVWTNCVPFSPLTR